MSQPPPYNPAYSFTDFAAANPTSPPPGVRLDAEFANLNTTIDATLVNLALIQRDDGNLANASVGADQLGPTAILALAGAGGPAQAAASAAATALSQASGYASAASGSATAAAGSASIAGIYASDAHAFQLASQAAALSAQAFAVTSPDFANVTGPTKPSNNATRNIVTYNSTAPIAPVDGDLWVDTSGTFAVFKLRSGGAWVAGANALSAYNSLSGVPVALADINTTESTKLSGIAANATRNLVTYSSTTPIAPIDGDLWVDTTGAFAVFKLRTSGVWQTGANALSAYSALSGRPIALADINSTESAKLVGIANGATRNVVTYSSTAPVSPVDGDLWVDTSGTFAIFKLRSAGAWVTGANALSAYSTLSGVPVALADINTTESSKLAGIAAGATVGAPTGTTVAGRNAADVAATVAAGGGVATNQVPTGAIQSNAVTTVAAAFTGAATPVGTAGTWTAIQTVSFTSSGSPVIASLSFAASTGSSVNQFGVRLLRNGVQVWIASQTFTAATNTYGTVAYAPVDTPSSGAVTYTLQVSLGTSSPIVAFTDATLSILETKR